MFWINFNFREQPEEHGSSVLNIIKSRQINLSTDIFKEIKNYFKQNKKYNLNEIEIIDDLSKGSFGDVKLVRINKTPLTDICTVLFS